MPYKNTHRFPDWQLYNFFIIFRPHRSRNIRQGRHFFFLREGFRFVLGMGTGPHPGSFLAFFGAYAIFLASRFVYNR